MTTSNEASSKAPFTLRGLALRSLRFYWQSHLGVMIGVAITCAVIVGALAVGDSVRATLAGLARQRIGAIDVALVAGDRFFGASMAARLRERLDDAAAPTSIATTLELRGFCRTTGGAARSGLVSVHGVEASFFELAPRRQRRAPPVAGQCFIDRRLAARLGVDVGATILVRVEKPSAVPRDMALATIDDVSVALRVEVEALLDDEDFGAFSLVSMGGQASNVFFDLAWLQAQVEVVGRANAIFLGAAAGEGSSLLKRADEALAAAFELADAELDFVRLPEPRDAQRDGERTVGNDGLVELRSGRIFIDPCVERVAREARVGSLGLLTYFVNSIQAGERATPYSMMTAVAGLGKAPLRDARLRELAAIGDATGIVANAWLAKDLALEEGARVDVAYYVMGNALELRVERASFEFTRALPLSGVVADPSLMPAFPGLADSDNCRDWEPGIPIDRKRIRDVDEEYWDEHRGTPKAFLSLERGRAIWGNRFGALTALRATSEDMDALAATLRTELGPRDFGLAFVDLRSAAMGSGTSATDFGGLFAGLSFFLIIAALLLTALLFVFGVEKRSREIGTLLALGYRVGQVRAMFRMEALLLAVVGSIVGAGLGVLYARFVLFALSTVWKDAVAETVLRFDASPLTVVLACVASILISWLATLFVLRKCLQQDDAKLLTRAIGAVADESAAAKGPVPSFVLAAIFGIVALGIWAFGASSGGSASAKAGAFFGAGAASLVSAVLLCRAILRGLASRQRMVTTLDRLALANAARRRGRSLAVIALLASGCFLVTAIQSQRIEAPRDVRERASGSGGFVLIGNSTLPVLRDLASEEGRDAFGLGSHSSAGKALTHASIVPMRVRDGDDASCLNLGMPQAPRLVAVASAELARREAFRFASTLAPTTGSMPSNPWQLLAADYGEGVVPAIGDAASVAWAMKKQVGEGFRYVDEAGRSFEVRIVATLDASMLQGELVIDEARFVERFPSAAGYRRFLVDVEPGHEEAVTTALVDGLEDLGLELVPARLRLQQLAAVQNSYLLIFQVLGGLGLLLGSLGIGVVVLRNVLERRAELGMLAALGYSGRDLRRLVRREHHALVLAGLACGAGAALVALLSDVVTRGAVAVLVQVAVVVGIIGVAGLVWVALATRAVLRDEPLEALRSE